MLMSLQVQYLWPPSFYLVNRSNPTRCYQWHHSSEPKHRQWTSRLQSWTHLLVRFQYCLNSLLSIFAKHNQFIIYFFLPYTQRITSTDLTYRSTRRDAVLENVNTSHSEFYHIHLYAPFSSIGHSYPFRPEIYLHSAHLIFVRTFRYSKHFSVVLPRFSFE